MKSYNKIQNKGIRYMAYSDKNETPRYDHVSTAKRLKSDIQKKIIS